MRRFFPYWTPTIQYGVMVNRKADDGMHEYAQRTDEPRII